MLRVPSKIPLVAHQPKGECGAKELALRPTTAPPWVALNQTLVPEILPKGRNHLRRRLAGADDLGGNWWSWSQV